MVYEHARDDRRRRHPRHRARPGGRSAADTRSSSWNARPRPAGPRSAISAWSGCRAAPAASSRPRCAPANCGRNSAPTSRVSAFARRIADAAADGTRGRGRRRGGGARGRGVPRLHSAGGRPGAGAQPGPARQVPGGPSLFVRRRRRVTAGAAGDARLHGRHRAIHLSSAHRGAVRRRSAVTDDRGRSPRR